MRRRFKKLSRAPNPKTRNPRVSAATLVVGLVRNGSQLTKKKIPQALLSSAITGDI
jgi:hypothetical protein